jgi:hypothetical protein
MLPDMSAKVSFLPRKLAPEEIKPRLAAGRSALIDRNGSTFAYLLQGNRVRETPVRVRATFGDMVEIHPSPFTENPVCRLETGERGVPVPVLPFSPTVVTGPKNGSSGLSILVKKVYRPPTTIRQPR